MTGLARRLFFFFFFQKLRSNRIHYCYIILRNVEGKKKACPFLLLENSRPLSPWGPLNFLSTCLGIVSLAWTCLSQGACRGIRESSEICMKPNLELLYHQLVIYSVYQESLCGQGLKSRGGKGAIPSMKVY